MDSMKSFIFNIHKTDDNTGKFVWFSIPFITRNVDLSSSLWLI